MKIFLTNCSDSWIRKNSEFRIENSWNHVKQKYDNFIFSSPKNSKLFFEIGEVKFGYYEKGSKFFDATESNTLKKGEDYFSKFCAIFTIFEFEYSNATSLVV